MIQINFTARLIMFLYNSQIWWVTSNGEPYDYVDKPQCLANALTNLTPIIKLLTSKLFVVNVMLWLMLICAIFLCEIDT